uniref:Uncharacterized protein n=1 Tax=Sus scrofa TaxID=9823 RepID=A0A8D1DUY8_PIG
MLLSVTSRPGISTFGYNKNNKKVGKSDFFGIQLLPFLGIGIFMINPQLPESCVMLGHSGSLRRGGLKSYPQLPGIS